MEVSTTQKLTDIQKGLLETGAASPDGTFGTRTLWGRGSNNSAGRSLVRKGLAVFVKDSVCGLVVYRITDAGREALKG